MADTSGVKRKSWLKRILLGGVVLIVVLVIAGYLLVPVIAASKAPGIIEEAAGKSIKGTVKVGSVSVGWGGPVIAKDVELRDPEGKRVAVLQLESSLGIWKVIGGLSDLGTTKVSGRIDVVRTTDANGRTTTNLERAIESKGGVANAGGTNTKSGSGGKGQIPAMSGTLEVTGIDATFEDRTPSGVTGQAAMKALKGTVAFSTAGVGSADAKLDAGFGEKLDGPATGSLSIKGGGKGFVNNGTLAAEKADLDVTVAAKGAPVNLIDALAGQKGMLSGALGPTADATVTAKGPLNALNADVVVQAPNATADLGVKSDAGRLHATRKGTIMVKSLAFVEKVPSVAAALRDSGVAISGWPGVSVAVNSLDLPAGGEGASWAGAKIEVSAFTTGNVTGTIARPGPDGKPGAPEALVVKPITVGIVAPDLVKGVELIGNTEATIGGQSAGALDLNVQLTEIIGADGKLLAATGGVPGKVVGTLDAKKVSTSLLAPLVAGSGVPFDLGVDIGPTLDLSVNATTKGDGAAAGNVPPTTIAINARSANLALTGSLMYDSTGLGLASDKQPLELVVQRSAPLVQRLLASGAKPNEKTPTVNGSGLVQLTVKSLRVPVSGKKIDATLASVAADASVADLVVQLNDGSTHPPSVGARRVQVSLQALPRGVSSLTTNGDLLLDGRSARLSGDLKIGGLLEAQDVPRLGVLGTRRLSGTLAVTGVPGASVQALAVGSGSDALKRVVAELVGTAVDVRVNFGDKTNQSAQPVALTLAGPALNAAVACELRNDSLELARAEGNAALTDALAKAVLELAGQKGDAVAAAHLRSPTGLSFKMEQPATVPLKAETVTPEWTRARSIVGVSLGLAKPAIVDGLKVEGRSVSAGVANCSLNASVPLSLMDTSGSKAAGTAGLKLAGTMDLVGNDERDVLARLRADGASAPDGTDPHINLSLTDVSTARLDEIAGQGGLLPGLLGDKATVVASLSRSNATGAGAKTPQPQTEIGLDVQSPQLTLTKGRFVLTNNAYSAAGPFTVALNASPNVIERLVGTKPGEAASSPLRVGESVHLTLNVSKLVLSASGEDKAGGPLKPGVFALDAVATTPKLVLLRAPEPGAARTAAPVPTELNDLTATLKSTGDASKSGLTFNASVGSIKSGDQTVKDATVVRGSIDNIADVGGNVRTETAVLNLNATTGKIPTAIIEALMSGSGRLTELLGSELTADIDARDVSKTGTSGFLNIKLKSPNANVAAAGPVSNGVFDTSAPGATPLRVELNEFKFDGGGKVLSLFPVFAQMQRAAGESNKGPALLASRGLKLPIDGDMTKLSGVIDVDIGRIDYEFSQALGTLLDETIFRGGRGLEQRAVPRFTINIDRGVLRYGSVQEKVVLPVRNLDFQLRGVVDLVNKRLDVVTYVPTLAAAPGLVANLNSTVGGALGKLVPGVVDKITAIPVRVEGPMDNPKTAYAPQIVLDEFKDALNPGNLIKGIGDLLAPKNQQPSTQPAPKPVAPAKPASPNTPTGPTGPTAPKKK